MIAAYIRVSTDKQNLANQKEEIQRFAREQGMEIDVWVKETISGKTPSGKRKLGWLMRKVRKGDTLIVSEISRLSRSLTEIMEIMGKCLEKNIRLYTVKERYSFDDSINSKVLCFAFGLVAEIERNLISMRTKEALAVKTERGRHSRAKKNAIYAGNWEFPETPGTATSNSMVSLIRERQQT